MLGEQGDLRGFSAALVLCGIALARTPATADAITCYVLFDRSDNVVYQDLFPPVDMSDQGAAERAALRQRGEYLMILDTEQCIQVEFVFGPGGSSALSVDQIIGGLRPFGEASRAPPTQRQGPRGISVPSPAAPSSPAPAPRSY